MKQHYDFDQVSTNQTGTWSMLVITALLWLALLQTGCVNTDDRANLTQAKAPVGQEPTLVATGKWTPLAKDALHDMAGLRDPGNPVFQLLQEPGEGLSGLPANKPRPNLYAFGFGQEEASISEAGNKVDWVEARKTGAVSPRRSRTPPATVGGIEEEGLVMDMDILLNSKGGMPVVRFPHLAHTLWLACANCHPAIFEPRKGANKLSMGSILAGEQCGICHSAVSFPLTECSRCHSDSHMPPIVVPDLSAGGRQK